jgi:HEAT repeat protein
MQKDPEMELRLAAIEAMGETVEPGVMTRLMETAARGTPRAVAEAARRRLAKLRPAQSIVGLYAGSRAVPHAQAVAEMLKAKGDYEQQLEKAMEEINPAATPKKAERIPEPFELAAAKLQAGNRDERLMAAYDLGVLVKAESEEPLRAALKDEDADVALAAAESLGKLPQVKAPEKLVELLSAEKAALPGTRKAAARACGLVKPAPDGARVAAALSAEKDAGAQVELAQALGRLKPPGAAAPLVALLSDGAPAAKAKAAWALGQLGDKAVCGDLISALEKAGNDAELKEELAGALSALTGKSLGTDAAKWRAAVK